MIRSPDLETDPVSPLARREVSEGLPGTWLPTRISSGVKTCKLSLSEFHHFSQFTSPPVFGGLIKRHLSFTLKFYTIFPLGAGINSAE